MISESVVTSTLLDLSRATAITGAPWALVGGQALIAYGVPRETLDADALVEQDMLGAVASELVDTFGWTPLVYDESSEDYVETDEVVVHFMDDPVLFDIGEERQMIPLRSPLGLPVELLAAQHYVEQEMVSVAAPRQFYGVRVPIAPLGGVLLVKTKADRPKDVAAIEQAGEHLSANQVQEAVAWAKRRDESTGEDLQAILTASRVRRAPSRTKAYVRSRKP